MASCQIVCQILIILEFSEQIFEKYANTKFHENPFSGSRVVPCGYTRTGRRDEASSRFSKFGERSYKGGAFVDWVAVSISRGALLHGVSDMRQAAIDYEAPLVQWRTLPL